MPPLVVHVIHALGVGGLENGLVNLINHMPPERYRHAIVCMTELTEFHRRIRVRGTEVIAMRRGNVPIWKTYARLIGYLEERQPAIVHSRNLSGLDALIPACIAGVKVRIHGEHGRDADDLDGRNRHNLRLRRFFRPFVSHYSAVSRDLAAYIEQVVGVPAHRITQIYNGVDTDRFRAASSISERSAIARTTDEFVIGTVGRLQAVKNQAALIQALAEARRLRPDIMRRARLVIVGEGPCRREVEKLIIEVKLGDVVTLLGERADIPDVLRTMDLFVLPSLGEGISNTILEAMATGLPVLATRVGGNPELVIDGVTGRLVQPGDRGEMAASLVDYVADPGLCSRHGAAGRTRVEQEFSIHAMVSAYTGLYDRLLSSSGGVSQFRKAFRFGILPRRWADENANIIKI